MPTSVRSRGMIASTRGGLNLGRERRVGRSDNSRLQENRS